MRRIAAGAGKHRLKIVRILHRGFLPIPGTAGIAAIGVCNDFFFISITS